MGQQILNTIKEQGYCVVRNVIDVDAVAALDRLHDLLIPQRGHDFDAVYFPKNKLDQTQALAVWWSQQVVNWPTVEKINSTLMSLTQGWFDNQDIYVSDVISNEPGNKFVKPHIDSPYRFDRWHDVTELLGVQCIVPLCKFDKESGGTGIYPTSHLKNWIVQESYRGTYTQEFLANMIQPEMLPGDVLIYNPRLLHSTMPNSANATRRALLTHITTREMVKELKKVDNIWLELSTE
jgi:ectoine hydroxylase-related dioxygenase (phytanoyl-CoA dioxygenase family)